ncbi:MAG: hypothetical protein ABSF95_05415 [Verrucomicrobiota bacterium]|jgi:hypothetical protein
MKVAYLAESSADRAALAILVEAILGRETEPVRHAGLEHRGWPDVRRVLPAVLKELHYHRDAEGLALVVDSNSSPPHLANHEPPNPPAAECRLCQLRGIADKALREVRPLPGRPPLKLALGLAVPTIEAWLLCGKDPHVTEAAWINGLKARQMPYSKDNLKEWLYRTTRPSLAVETEAMKAAATRLSRDLSAIESLFPHGFGALLRSLRSW